MFRVDNISMSFDGKDVLKDISFSISDGQKVGLVGKNGVGKSSLMKILCGIIEPTEGKIVLGSDIYSIGYLRQEFELNDLDKIVSDYIDEMVGLTEIARRLDELSNSDLTISDNFEEYCKINDAFLAMDGYNFEYRKEITFAGLSLDKNILQKKISELSGGQKSKVLLSVVLLMNADLLLLDEPTNNLDIKSIQWLDDYLAHINTSCLIISHDRTLLDHVVTRIIEIDENTKCIIEFSGNYSNYLEFKEKQISKQLLAYEAQQEQIVNMRKSIQQKKTWASMGRYQGVSDNDKYTRGYERDRSSSIASSAKRIEKKINQLNKIERPIIREPMKIVLNLSDDDKATVNIMTRELVCGYSNEFRVKIGTKNIEFGDKILILGDNGTGKTTFIKTILAQIPPISGDVVVGSGVKFGILLQQEFKGISSKNLTVEEYIRENTTQDEKIFFTALINYGFSYEDRNKKINILSPGEIARLYLLICSLNLVNVLIFDEPTNYLDIEALEALEEIISTFEGTIIASSHDRYFIKRFQPKVIFEFKDGQMIDYIQ